MPKRIIVANIKCKHESDHEEFNPDLLRQTKIKGKHNRFVLECVQCYSFVD